MFRDWGPCRGCVIPEEGRVLACSLGAEPEGVLRSLVGCKEGHVR